jgi:hypothetical protein
LLCGAAVVAGDVLGAQASAEDVLAAVLAANQQLTRLVAELREENARQAGELIEADTPGGHRRRAGGAGPGAAPSWRAVPHCDSV